MSMNLSALKAKIFPAQTGFVYNAYIKDMDILDHIEKIVEISKKYNIEKSLSKGKAHLDYVACKLGINHVQTVLFSHFLNQCDDNYIGINDIANSIECSKVKIIKYLNECEELEKKKLILCSRNEASLSFRVPREVSDSLRKFNEFRLEKTENLSVFKLFGFFGKLLKGRKNNELTYDILIIEISDLINQNMHLEFCKKIMSHDFDKTDLIMLIFFCYYFWYWNYNCITSDEFEFLYDKDFNFWDIRDSLSNGSSSLMQNKYIERANNFSFTDSETWKLTEKAKRELLFELTGNRNYKNNLILCDKIIPKTMFYNSRETEEIKTLASFLMEKNYRKILERLDAKGMRKGFACLFSGSPGTGKTETAYQIARETKRHIMMVDISQTKSCWYGESEKNVKAIFDTYRSAVNNSAVAPILLFNEADAVICKRQEVGGLNPSMIQTENAIQNIILSEMENLSGIMIATTNLIQNMDKAFERRFLYKINFDKPGMESRKNIWNTLIPNLPVDTIEELSNRFELSGGQIENIARKLEVDAILNGSNPSMDTLVQYCKEEYYNSFNTEKRIGFGNE